MADNLKYRFFLGWAVPHGIQENEIQPYNAAEFKLIEKVEKPYFFTRLNFSGNVVLMGKDYALVKSIEEGNVINPCDYLFFIIKKNTGTQFNPVWVQVWFGYFNKIDCSFDLDGCQCEFTPTVYDKYTEILPHLDDEINLFDAVEGAECDAEFKSGKFEYLLGVSDTDNLNDITHHKVNGCYVIDDVSGTNEPFFKAAASGNTETTPAFSTLSNSNQYGWMLYDETMSIQDYFPAQYWRVFSKWIREYEINDSQTVAPAGSGWMYDSTILIAGVAKYKWVREPYNGVYDNYILGGQPCNNWAVVRFTLDLSLGNPIVQYKKGRSLWSCFELCAQKLSLSGFLSTFFSIPNSILYDEQGIFDRHLRFTQIHSVADMKQPTSDEYTTDWKVRISDFLSSISAMFNVSWFIAQVGTEYFLQIEHISNTEFTQGANISDLRNLDGGFATKLQNRYSYIKNELIHREKWSMNPEMSYPDFKGVDIIYNQVCSYFRTKPNSKDYNCGKFVTDLQLLYSTPADVSDDSLMLIDVEPMSGTYAGRNARYASGKITGMSMINGNFSLANLHYDFWRKGRILAEGSMNNETTEFLTYKKPKKQDQVKIAGCTDIPFRNIIRTELGDGELEEKTLSLMIDEYELTILYP